MAKCSQDLSSMFWCDVYLHLKEYLRLAPRLFSLIQCVVSSAVSRHRSWSLGQVWRQRLVCPLSSTLCSVHTSPVLHTTLCTPPLSCTPHCAHQPCPAHHHSAHHHLLSPKEHNTTKTLVRVLDLHWVSFAPCGLSPCSQTPFGDRILGEAANTIFRGFPFTDLHQQLSPLQELLPLPLCLPPLLLLESLPVLWN